MSCIFKLCTFMPYKFGPSFSCAAILCLAILMVRHFHVMHFQSTQVKGEGEELEAEIWFTQEFGHGAPRAPMSHTKNSVTTPSDHSDAFATLPLPIPSVAFLKLTASSRLSAPPSGSPKCLRFGLWLTLCTLSIDLLTYLPTYLPCDCRPRLKSCDADGRDK